MQSDIATDIKGYIDIGFSIIPVRPDKKPAGEWKEFQNRRATHQEADVWFKAGGQAAIVTGSISGGLVVIDADNDEAVHAVEALLPDSLETPIATTPRGRHYFFKSSQPVKNATGVMPGVDVRGQGGYVCAPPAPGREWLISPIDCDLAELPPSIAALLDKPSRPEPRKGDSAASNSYGLAALRDELTKLAMAQVGARNATLNTCAFKLGQLVGAGELEESAARSALIGSALALGLPPREVEATVDSGLKSGKQEPRGKQMTTMTTGDDNDDSCRQLTTDDDSYEDEDGFKYPGSITAAVREYVENSTGCFTNNDIYNDLVVKARSDRQAVSKALGRLVEKNILKRDHRQSAKFHILDTKVEFIDLDGPDDENFDLALPLDLGELVKVPPKSVICLAGSTNAGKTAIALNFARLNLEGKSKVFYAASEMGKQEMRQRVRLFGDPPERWRPLKPVERMSGFPGLVQHHNPNGITIIDYIEAIDGEFWRIGSDIRDIYDALGNGVVFICIQKRSDKQYGRGGEMTAEKARLYLTLDHLCQHEDGPVCCIKVTKCKNYVRSNPNGKERHFKIVNGHELQPLSDWHYMSDDVRERRISRYRSMPEAIDTGVKIEAVKGNKLYG